LDIVEAALKNRHKQFVIDGEAVVLGVDGIADFDALHSRKYEEQVQLYSFDILALDGDDLRGLPLSLRKTNLARLLARRPDGIFVASFEQGEIGPDLFRTACRMGLEGLVSKRRDQPYQAGRSKHWVKVKNRMHSLEIGLANMRGPATVIVMSCLLAAYVVFDLAKTLRTGRARSRYGTFTRKNQPGRFWRYIYSDYVVLAFCIAAFCWAVFWPDSFR
jgi:ATP-dependent DNA ligase